ncbi:hypothetical protein [Muricoccus radiodurans]
MEHTAAAALVAKALSLLADAADLAGWRRVGRLLRLTARLARLVALLL